MKIVSLAPSNTEILFEIGAGEKVVATTSLCDFPDEARKLPSVGGWTSTDVEKVERLDPDMVLANDRLQDSIVEALEERGIDVEHFKPRTLEDVFETVIEIGKITGKANEAEELVAKMRRELVEIRIDEETRIYCEEWSDPPMVSGNWVPGLVERIGGQYPIDEGERSREVSVREIRRFDPEFIFLNVCGAGENFSAKRVSKRDEWQSVEAVRKGNVFVIDDSLLNRPGPRLVKGAESMAEKIRE